MFASVTFAHWWGNPLTFADYPKGFNYQQINKITPAYSLWYYWDAPTPHSRSSYPGSPVSSVPAVFITHTHTISSGVDETVTFCPLIPLSASKASNKSYTGNFTLSCGRSSGLNASSGGKFINHLVAKEYYMQFFAESLFPSPSTEGVAWIYLKLHLSNFFFCFFIFYFLGRGLGKKAFRF